MDIGDVVGREISQKGDSDDDTLQAHIEVNDSDDVRTSSMFGLAGVDTSPRDGARAAIESTGKSWQVVIACDDGSTSVVDAGDIEIYALDSAGVRQGKVRCKSDGQVIVNGGAGTAVEFSRLKTAFDQLKSDFDAHVHPAGAILDSTGGACTGSTAAVVVGTTADMAPAESPTVNIP
jgi:hypothetical protein